MSSLPTPSIEALNHSLKLQAFIQNICAHKNGYITFKHFMQLALYSPLGYYSAGSQKIGRNADFMTAPEISPLFGQTLAYAMDQILQEYDILQKTDPVCILELGAGSGKLAADILQNLQYLPEKYYILELSADLKARQKEYLKNNLSPALFKKIEWLDSIENLQFSGIIFANEVLDALPVHHFSMTNNILQEAYIGYKNNNFYMTWGEPTQELREAINSIDNLHSIKHEMRSEINSDLNAYIYSLAKCLNTGVLLFIDYGFNSAEYYHPDRTMGTLSCYYQHKVHYDPLQYIGLCDISAHVDFSAVAKAATNAQLQVAGFSTQGAYLLANNLPQLAEKAFQTTPAHLISQQIQKLTSPQEMGELCKVVAFTKNWTQPLSGFDLCDQRHRL